MLSLLRKVFFLTAFLAVVLFIGREYFLIYGSQFYVLKRTGFILKVESVDFSKFQPPLLLAYNITFENPDDFEVANALHITRLEARGPKDFWENLEKPRLNQLSIAIDELSVVRNSAGKVNALMVEEFAKSNPGRIHPYPFINDFVLSIDKVSFYDCFGMTMGGIKPDPQVVTINLKNQHYRNVQNVSQLQRLILREALKRTHFTGLEDTYRSLEIGAPAPVAPAQ